MERFVIQRSTKLADGWVITDKQNGIVIVFEDKRFNETKKITMLEDVQPSPMAIARAMREIGDWVYANHRDKVLP